MKKKPKPAYKAVFRITRAVVLETQTEREAMEEALAIAKALSDMDQTVLEYRLEALP